MRLLILPRYGRKGAASRYRFWQYLPMLEEAGHQVDIQPLLDDSHLERLYAGGGRCWYSLALAYLRRLRDGCQWRNYDAVLVDQELLPYCPALFERFAAELGGRYVVDYDDAAYCKYAPILPLRRKIPKLMAASRAVVVGNHHLAQYARQFASDVRLIPTVVDVGRYTPKRDYDSGALIRICWIGTPITAALFLPAVVPVLYELRQRFPKLRFRFIGVQRLERGPCLGAEFRDWSEPAEASLIGECDIGIMPLQDDEFARGKCGLKLIQYMAAGLPVVGSPVGENRHIIADGWDGFHASQPAQWLASLALLIQDQHLREQMGRRGRAKVERQYSLAYGFEQWQRLLQDITSAGGRASSTAIPTVAYRNLPQR